mgnify:CR=1 FL=1
MERIHDSQERYLSWVDAQQGPTGKERHVYGLYRISDGCGYCEQQLRDLEKLNADLKQRIEGTGSLIVANTPEQFAAQIAAEFEVYKKVVAQQKLTLE